MRIVVSTLFVISAFALTASAQWVYGDSAKKRYFGIDCEVEIGAIERSNSKGFKTATEAEKAGYVRGESCTKEPQKTQPPVDWDALGGNSRSVPKPTAPQKPVRLKLKALTSDVVSYVERDVQIRASIEISTSYHGAFEGMEKIAYAFEIRDDTGSLTAYMDRGPASERLRKILLGEALGKDLVGLVTIRIPKNNYSSKNFWNEALFLSYADLKIWEK